MDEERGWGEDLEELGGGKEAGLPEGRPAGPGLPRPGSAVGPGGRAGAGGAKTEWAEAAAGGGEYFAGAGDEILRPPRLRGPGPGHGGRKLAKPQPPLANGLESGEMDQMLARWGVILLLSPPGMPRYDGSIEAAIGNMKALTSDLARRAGQADWTADLAEGARLLANRRLRPWGPLCPCAEEVFYYAY